MDLENISSYDNPCTGCGACVAECLQNAISIELNENGFYEASVDENKCIGCKKCLSVCIRKGAYNTCYNISTVDVIAARSIDKEILSRSSSGGIVSELYYKGLEKKYRIVGTIYDTDIDMAKMALSDSDEYVAKFAGSKYLQSYTYDAIQQTIHYLKEYKGNNVIIVGTPCQIYGIDKLLKEYGLREQCLLVDFFCHGIPSYHLWQSYISQIKKMMKVSKFDDVIFRDKKYGWKNYWISISGKNARYSSLGSLDEFYNAYFSNQFLNDCCYLCKLRNEYTCADIRVGDYWGRIFDDNSQHKGVSAVMVFTDQGKTFLNECSNLEIIGRYNAGDRIQSQSGIEYSVKNKALLEMIKKGYSLKRVIKEYNSTQPLRYNMRYYIKRILRHLPNTIVYKLRNSNLI